MRVDQLVPEVYYRESRDFSYIGRLFEIVFNYMKMHADLTGINLDNDKVNADLIELAAKTVGFETKHDYVNKDLLAVVNNFSSIVKQKGTLVSIERAARLLSSCHELKLDDNAVTLDSAEPYKVNITLPYGSTDIVILEDLLSYILPAGWLYEIQYSETLKEKSETTIKTSDDVKYEKLDEKKAGQIYTGTTIPKPDEMGDNNRFTWYKGQVVSST